jgi:hypothetical protein
VRPERKGEVVVIYFSMHSTWGGPMESTAYLRRQALFCLKLSRLCADDLLANHLTRKAAEYHEKALRTEFEAELDPDERDRVRGARLSH